MLGGVGIVGAAWRGAARPGRALHNTPLRLECLVAVCLTAPPLAVAALGAHAYNGWRRLYFLHAPLALLAASGLRLLASRDAAWARRGTYAAAGVAAAGILIAMARIHPLQHVYFNCLVDRTTPEHLRTHVVPVDADDLPDDQVRHGFDNRDFNLPELALVDGKCLVTMRLPEYAVDHVRTGQTERNGDVWTALWEETIRIRPLRP